MADRGASVRIPWQVEIDQKGYIEDRRPNADVDPYVVTRLVTETVCSALEDSSSHHVGVGDQGSRRSPTPSHGRRQER